MVWMARRSGLLWIVSAAWAGIAVCIADVSASTCC